MQPLLGCSREKFGPVRVGEDYRSRMNHELYELYADINVVQRIAIQRLRWLGHVVRMDEEAPAKKVFEGPREPTQRKTIAPVERPGGGNPMLAWCTKLEKARAEQRRLERASEVGRNSVTGCYGHPSK